MRSFFRNFVCCSVSDADASARVLVVDDERMILDAVAATLELDGFKQVTCCESPQRALEHASHAQVDLVISDVCMPGMDGIELLAALAHDKPHVPRIVLTGRGDRELAERAIQIAQPFSWIEKPWCNRQLSAEVCRALQWSRELSNEPDEAARIARRARDLSGAGTEMLRVWL